MKRLLFLVSFLVSIIFTSDAFAQSNAFVSIINPVRGNDFWDIGSQREDTAVLGQIDILKKFNLSATWLVRFDALDNGRIIDLLKSRFLDEEGLFLEVTPSWATAAKVSYRQSDSWHAAGSAFLTGYERDEREKLIDTAFEKFQSIFGYFPTSVGAWWIDSYSLSYMQKKYGITGALIVADQYSTDNYQIWGQYFGTPYYPTKSDALHPAQSLESKLDVVLMQWATRDPVNGYGNGVMESTFSLQANDYIDYHDLDIEYFSSLIDIYTKQQFNQFAHMVVGLENSYSWKKYAGEYKKQIEVLATKKNSNQLSVITMKDFAGWYRKSFPQLSPEQLIIADDPLGSYKKAIWFMNPYYRVGWFLNQDGSLFRDIRQYIDGEEELCFKVRCDSVNFATSATRVLDDVSFGHKWLIDQGKISDFKVEKKGEEFIIGYKNEAGNLRKIGFLPRDIRIDEKIYSIDGAILNATKKENVASKSVVVEMGSLKWSFASVIMKISKFLIFLTLMIILPGYLLAKRIFKRDMPILLRLFISVAVGFVMLTLLFYVTSLFKIKPLIFVYLAVSLFFFIRIKPLSAILKIFNSIMNGMKGRFNLILILVILIGTTFQVIPTFKSGLNFGYGMGFWGPNTHDGVWHMALINQLIRSVPPENPIYSGAALKNYHFFYDILVAVTNYLSGIPVVDLLFRFYPIMFSLMLGVGSYYLLMRLFENRIGKKQAQIATFLSLYFIYFAGSFGWIVEFLRERHFGGESAFWVNQAVSFNLNPPFAVSLVIVIVLFHILFNLSNFLRIRSIILAVLIAGSLIGFKSYGAVLVLTSILFVGLVKKQFSYLLIFIGALLISTLIFLPNFEVTSSLVLFVPFWFIHSMVDSPDRVGWIRLTLAREAGFETNNWFKFISAEVLSLIIFIFGNLGVRIVSLFSLIKIKSIVKDEKLIFIFIFAFLSFLIPILFIQSGNPWNTIQFSYYGLYISALVSGVVLLKVLKLPKYISVPVISIILLLAPINSVVTANGYFGRNPHAFISVKEIQGLQFLSNQQDGVVLTFPYDEKLKQKIPEPWPILAYDSTAYVSALSQKAVYLEDEPQNAVLLTDYKKKSVASMDFFLKPIAESINFLQENNIKYVYLPKIFNVRLDESLNIVKNIFENEEVVIYQVKQ